ncbi:hypothetical protein A9G09_11715 [Gilliamella sp. wkB292]|uniref:ADP-ribosylglycohydrolase family protein n=1 Tax=unclassified Gilliamella TaxID=2685620 RepID=UPI00080E3822|nr:ADP-ribosylglycohydrolase family protein [Gilliamella apicola]OCG10774.1 hypothetical protein A9G09_11715 [Gilliamella apicola]OCL29750.1 hypothetical protein A9G03_00855 [Gilliamella apicola]
MSISKENKILGTFYGQAIGDAMGMPSELWPRTKVQSYFGWIDTFLPGPKENNAACYFNQAQFTDDTSMALALADAIIECNGQIEPNTIANNIMKWAQNFDAFNKNVLGPTSKIALNLISQGKSIDSLENNGTTNGAAMRVSPLGCLLPADNLDDFIEQITLASSPTHKSDIAIAGAVTIAWAISKAIDNYSWQQIKLGLATIADIAQTRKITTFSPSISKRIELALDLAEKPGGVKSKLSDIYNIVGAGTSTLEAVPAALAIVEIAKTDPNQSAILCANLGGDTDTIGAMATAICGALNGVECINPLWIKQLNEANHLDFTHYSKEFYRLRRIKESANGQPTAH